MNSTGVYIFHFAKNFKIQNELLVGYVINLIIYQEKNANRCGKRGNFQCILGKKYFGKGGGAKISTIWILYTPVNSMEYDIPVLRPKCMHNKHNYAPNIIQFWKIMLA